MLNDEGKQKALPYIDLLIHPVSYVKETNMIPFPAVPADKPSMTRLRLYDARVSAGHSDFFDSAYYTTIEVPARDEKARILPSLSAKTVWNRHSMITTWFMYTSRKHWMTGKSGSSR